jgi:exopolyphosphatase/guanosine-5'-triphosphate,3'-diphosphate pyrophosphatase
MKIAIIDCGTNTFNLLIVEKKDSGSFENMHGSKIPVRIGKGGLNEGEILPDAMERAIKAIITHNHRIVKENCESVYIFATSAIRSASNGNFFCEEVKRLTGHVVNVISGEEEARLIFAGVKGSGVLTDEPTLIMDIGGGSCEFIVSVQKNPVFHASYEIGVSRLLDMFTPEDPISLQTIKRVEEYLEPILEPVIQASGKNSVQILVGSSGSFDTFSDLLHSDNKLKSRHKNFSTYGAEEFKSLYDNVITSTYKERLEMKGMAEFRAEMIVMSVIAVDIIIKKVNIYQIHSCRYSLKEGILFSL